MSAVSIFKLLMIICVCPSLPGVLFPLLLGLMLYFVLALGVSSIYVKCQFLCVRSSIFGVFKKGVWDSCVTFN